MSTGLPSPPHTPPPSTSSTDVAGTPGERRDGQAETQPNQAQTQPGRWAPSPTIARRELWIVALSGVLLAILTTWPLVLHMPSRIEPDLGDPVRTAWQVAWVGHAMLHNPLHIFNANAF